MEILGVIALLGVITYGFIKNGLTSFSSGEFWVLFFVLCIQFKHIIPEKFKSAFFYYWNKLFSNKYFDFTLSYSLTFSSELKTINEIFLFLEEKLKNEQKKFIKGNDGVFIFGEYMKIKYSYDKENEEQIISIKINNDKYTVYSLEKDLHFYKKIFGIIKDGFQINKQAISSNIKVNKFYTPKYLLKKYSNGYNQIEIKIEDEIILKRNINNEELIIKSGDNLDDITDKLKQYIKLTL